MTLNIIFYGGEKAGMITLLAIMAKGHKVLSVIYADNLVKSVADMLGLPAFDEKCINNDFYTTTWKYQRPDLFVCCHGRKIIKKPLLDENWINIHPCLYKYKGLSPIKRALEDGNTLFSVGCHYMTDKVDEGMVYVENFIRSDKKTEIEVYNDLYPLYVKTIIETLVICDD